MSIEKNLSAKGLYSSTNSISKDLKYDFKFSDGTDLNLVDLFQTCLSGFSFRYFFLFIDINVLVSVVCLFAHSH